MNLPPLQVIRNDNPDKGTETNYSEPVTADVSSQIRNDNPDKGTETGLNEKKSNVVLD